MATKISSPPAEDAMSASKVLGDEDMLGEILRRVDSPRTLVRAALACKRWLRAASARDFLRRFVAFHPPRLLGFYITGGGVPRPEFFPMPAPQPPDPILSAALRRASNSVFDALPECSAYVWDCRDGRVLFDFTEIITEAVGLRVRRRFRISDPLRHPDRGVAELPPPPPAWPQPDWHAVLLPDDGNDDASCYILYLHHSGPTVTALVGVLRSGAWTVHCSAETALPTPPDRIPKLTKLAAGKLYMVAVAGYILGLDMATASFFVVDLPEGVAYEHYGNLVPCRGDGSVLYLFHLKGDRLCVWLRRMGEQGAGEWVLRDTISLRETCGHLVDTGFEPAAASGHAARVVGVGDNAEFVFLELLEMWPSSVFVCFHFSSRKVEKVYQRHPDNDEITHVRPWSMVWHPMFPSPDEGEGEPLHDEEEASS